MSLTSFVHSTKWRLWLLFFVPFVVYVFSFSNRFVWDDEQFIVENTYVRDLSTWPEYFTTNTVAGAGFESNYYRPLTTLSFAIDNAIWGMHEFGFHLSNTLLHAMSAVLLYILLMQLFSLVDSKNSDTSRLNAIAFVTSLAFALHPVQVEAVVYMNSRGDSLSMAFGLLSAICFLWIQRANSVNKRILAGVFSFMTYVASVLSKEVGVVWIAIATSATVLSWKKKRSFGSVFAFGAQLTFLILYFLLRFTVLQFLSTRDIWGPGSVYANSLIVRVQTFVLHVFPEYINMLLYPVKLHMERDVPILASLFSVNASSLFVVIVYALTIFCIIWILLRKKLLPSLYLFIGGQLWFIVFLAPFSGIIPMNGLLYEHWLYVPMVGWWLSIFSLVFTFFSKKIATIFVSVTMLVWSMLSVRQILIWRTPIVFYEYTLQFTESARLRNNLGMAYAEENRNDDAIREYIKSLDIFPDYPQTHHNLANVYRAQGKFDEARKEYQQALALNPQFFFSVNALIEMELSQKNVEEAKRWATYGTKTFSNAQYYQTLLNELDTRE